MALFSTTEAIANFTNIEAQKIEPFQSGREFFSYQYYLLALGSAAIPFAQWNGQDSYWLVRDRQMSNRRWQTAMHLITVNQNSGYLLPFSQINSYYKIMHVWVVGRKHEIKWLHGAYSLVNALTQNYNALSYILQSKVIGLLKALNAGICNYAITNFYKLLYGVYAKSPRVGYDAWAFDRDFIIGEQIDTAFPIYNDSTYVDALEVMNELFNDVGWRALFKDIGTFFEKKSVSIPVFQQLYHSDITSFSQKYGQDARVEVPLVMLYPDHYFYNDQTPFGSDIDHGKRLKFSETLIAAIIKERESQNLIEFFGQALGAMLISYKDNPTVMYNAYLGANWKVMNIFK